MAAAVAAAVLFFCADWATNTSPASPDHRAYDAYLRPVGTDRSECASTTTDRFCHVTLAVVDGAADF